MEELNKRNGEEDDDGAGERSVSPTLNAEQPTRENPQQKQAQPVAEKKTAPTEEKKKDKWQEIYEQFYQSKPEKPNYKREKAELMGQALSSVFKGVLDTYAVVNNGHTVSPYESSTGKILDRMEAKDAAYKKQLADIDDHNNKWAWEIEKAREARDRWDREVGFKQNAETLSNDKFKYQKERDKKTDKQWEDNQKRLIADSEKNRRARVKAEEAKAKARQDAANAKEKPYVILTPTGKDGTPTGSPVPLDESQADIVFAYLKKTKGLSVEDLALFKEALAGNATSRFTKQKIAEYTNDIIDFARNLTSGTPPSGTPQAPSEQGSNGNDPWRYSVPRRDNGGGGENVQVPYAPAGQVGNKSVKKLSEKTEQEIVSILNSKGEPREKRKLIAEALSTEGLNRDEAMYVIQDLLPEK